MKFGKHLRLVAKGEWRDFYIDYSALKALTIRGGEGVVASEVDDAHASDGAEGDVNSDPDNDSRSRSRSSGLAVRSSKPQPSNAQDATAMFTAALLAEVQKASMFLASQTLQVRASVSSAAEAVDNSTKIDFSSSAVLSMLTNQLAPVPEEHGGCDSDGEEDGTGGRRLRSQSVGYAAGNSSFDASASGPTSPGLFAMLGQGGDLASELHPLRIAQAALLAASDAIDDLREFAKLNVVAAEKITKKFEKVWSSGSGGAAEGDLADSNPSPPHPPTVAGAAAGGASSASILRSNPAVAAALAPLRDMTELDSLSNRCIELSHTMPAPQTRSKPSSAAASAAVAQSLLGGDGGEGPASPSSMVSVGTVSHLHISSLPVGAVTCLRMEMGVGSLSEPILVPVMVARGAHSGPVLGITSAMHGNELNGIPVIHRLFKEIDCSTLCGVIIAVPIVNVVGYQRCQRGFIDGADLNRIMPGKKGGTPSQSFAHYLMTRVIKHMDYVLDLHTASFGRVNSLYIRADMRHPSAHRLAKLQAPQIIVHNTGPDGSLRGACAALGKTAITIEIGNPQVFHPQYVDIAYRGVLNTLSHLKMIGQDAVLPHREPVVCSRSFWIFTKTGGVLYVHPEVNEWCRKGSVIAEIYSVFGTLVDRILAPHDGIVVGKSTNPVCQTGDRVLHFGIVEDSFPEGQVNDGH